MSTTGQAVFALVFMMSIKTHRFLTELPLTRVNLSVTTGSIYQKNLSLLNTSIKTSAGKTTSRFDRTLKNHAMDKTSGRASNKVVIQDTTAAQPTPKQVVIGFLEEVRSGLHPEKSAHYMADTVLAHQINSENPLTVYRTPANYEAHVREFLSLFGAFEFRLVELLADGDRVYARWEQKGKHQAKIDHYPATGLPLLEFTSAVYRVANGKIVEYWLQSDRYGFEEQLKKNASTKPLYRNK
jgi:predicted ester cyclase